MLRTTTATVFAIAALALGIPAVADAAPAHCANHGTGHGQIYKHACATGSGGQGAKWVPVKNPDGSIKKVLKNGKLKTVYGCEARCGGGRHHVETTDTW
ncbi:hypothetical protein SEA_PHALCONET_26 [Mycobacterium phage Phalconet]|uniref:Uncharacterized protein n=1 Tax=Mycobacterium phage DLane TaxID=2922203 RepID=G1D1C0_9CAUD|nr:hypothetical protein SEAGREEN_27 [Mycobacterium phage Seagreen]YP_009636439.1 hypothetical protein FGG21_gp026 [Mycobacterium phage DLane]UVK58867.1 hypothetical protein SEA_LEOZINHO_27 [Mycobacterium phage Leozinho]UVK63014.1 hypothetical protein SEA_BEAKIN_27 [Mycobacterium phage Beakin]UXE03915.1 hypothetical protein SEA_PHALCONET_26 [Mycobacterium phage Phalconet]WAA20338.1 hypothetical protein SEA_VREDHORSE_26 [Mycobacterium phage VRedHorse]AEK08570.1 hypothetical protein PBI_DLANE_26